jgi:hypothetical protein
LSTTIEGAKSLLIDTFKMTSAGAAEAYELGVKIFGREGAPSENGLETLLAATHEELKHRRKSPLKPSWTFPFYGRRNGT